MIQSKLMIHTVYRITCDKCNRREIAEGDDSLDDVQATARSAGWVVREVENGAIWDFCPRCLEIEKIQNTATKLYPPFES